MTSQCSDMKLLSNFSRGRVFLVKFSHWFQFHINIMTGSGVMTVFFNKGLTRNAEIGNTPSKLFLISKNWGKLEIPNFS